MEVADMAKKYYVARNGSWHTWDFLRTRKNEPNWRAAYLEARSKRIRNAILSLFVLIIAALASLYFLGDTESDVIESVKELNPINKIRENVAEPAVPIEPVAPMESGDAVDPVDSVEAVGEEVQPIQQEDEELKLEEARQQIEQIMAQRAATDPDWAFLNDHPYGTTAWYGDDGRINVEVRQNAEGETHDSRVALFQEDETGNFVEVTS